MTTPKASDYEKANRRAVKLCVEALSDLAQGERLHQAAMEALTIVSHWPVEDDDEECECRTCWPPRIRRWPSRPK